MRSRFANYGTDRVGCKQDFRDGAPSGSACATNEVLANNRRQHLRELCAYLSALGAGECVDDSVYRFDGVSRVQSCQDKMPGLGSDERRLHRSNIAHFADHDYIGIRAQSAGYGVRTRNGIPPNFTLSDDGMLIHVTVLDRVFDRNYSSRKRGIDAIDDGR